MVEKLIRKIRQFIFRPDFPKIDSLGLFESLGSKYGSKAYLPTKELLGCTIVSAGCGEDISFDTEFVARWNATVILIDPTPRAIKHVKSVISKAGKPRKQPYNNSGNQSPESYDLQGVSDSRLLLVEVALWTENGSIDIFPPKDMEHISHSILDLQNKRSRESGALRVRSRTLDSIMRELKLETLEILKLDIEGAEIEVLIDMFSKGIYPKQILVEFDEILFPSRASQTHLNEGLFALKSHGYQCFYRNQAEFGFLRSHSQ